MPHHCLYKTVNSSHTTQSANNMLLSRHRVDCPLLERVRKLYGSRSCYVGDLLWIALEIFGERIRYSRTSHKCAHVSRGNSNNPRDRSLEHWQKIRIGHQIIVKLRVFYNMQRHCYRNDRLRGPEVDPNLMTQPFDTNSPTAANSTTHNNMEIIAYISGFSEHCLDEGSVRCLHVLKLKLMKHM